MKSTTRSTIHFICFVSLFFLIGDVVGRACDKEVSKCFQSKACRTTLTNLLEYTCKDLFSNFNYFSSESSKISCSKSCRKALKRAKRGSLKRLLTCKSNSSEYFPYQDRALRCLSGKIREKLHDNYVQNGCTNLFERCTKHTNCRRHYEEMMYKCNGMLQGSKCSTACEIALQTFLMSKKTQGFFQCRCDGAFYFQKTCHSLKQNIATQCVSQSFKLFVKQQQQLIS